MEKQLLVLLKCTLIMPGHAGVYVWKLGIGLKIFPGRYDIYAVLSIGALPTSGWSEEKLQHGDLTVSAKDVLA